MKKTRLGTKPLRAAALLLLELRVQRERCEPFVKSGFTLLQKRGLVENRKGEYRPIGGFFDACEDVGLTVDGFATKEAIDQAKRAIKGQK